MKYVDPIGMPRKLRKACSFWLSTDEREYLKKQLEIYRERIVREERPDSIEERAGDNHD